MISMKYSDEGRSDLFKSEETRIGHTGIIWWIRVTGLFCFSVFIFCCIALLVIERYSE